MSLLRSTRLFRCFTSTRNFVLKPSDSKIITYSRIIANHSLFREYNRPSYARSSNGLEGILQKLDADVRRLGRVNSRDLEDVMDVLRSKLEVNSVQALMILGCCGDLLPEELPQQRTKIAQQIWKTLAKRGVPLDISHYNALLLCYIQNEHPFSPEEILKELESKGFIPNRVTYQRLMWRYCQEGDLDGATRLLEKMRDQGLPVSEPVLNALVMGHAFHGDPEGAKAVLETMSAAGLKPSSRTYALLASGHAKKGDIDAVRNIIEDCASKEIFLSDKDIIDIIEHLVTNNHTIGVDYLLDKLPRGASYVQNTLNLIIRLINSGHESAAKSILETIPKPRNLDGESSPYRGSVFVKQLIKSNTPAERVVQLCKELQADDLAPLALKTATEQALIKGDVHLAQLLMKELKNVGNEIRPHYFWPLLVKHGKEGDEEGLLSILRFMLAEGVAVTSETLKNYVIPYLLKKNSIDNTILKIQGVGMSSFFTARNVVLHLLEENDLKLAAKVAVNYRPWGKLSLLSQPLISSVSKTKDVESFAKIVQVACGGNQGEQEERNVTDEAEPDAPETKVDPKVTVGYVVFGAVRGLKDVQLTEELFTSLLAKGIGINSHHAEKIQEYLGEKMTIGLTEKLAQLCSDDLSVEPVYSSRGRGRVIKSPSQLEQALAKARESGTSTADISKQLITSYIQTGNEEKLNEFITELENENFIFTGPTLSQLIEFYSKNDQIEKALKYYQMLHEREPDFELNEFKVMYLAFALLKAQRFDEAVAILKNNQHERDLDKQSFVYNSLLWQTLNHLAEAKDETKLKEWLNTLLEYKYAQPSNVLLGPLIKLHILKDDLDTAIKEFENCCKKFRCTPWKSELTRRLIETKDANKLQHVTDLSTEIHGEVNSLYDLVFGFVECGRLTQARRILETPGLRTRTDRLNWACERYLQEGKTEYIEGLLEATKKLSHIDRANIFYYLLVSYTKANETDKALGLWTLLQEDGELPSEQFLVHLADHLKAKNIEVPFVVPKSQTQTTTPKRNQPKEQPKEAESELISKLNDAITSKNYEQIHKICLECDKQDNISKDLFSQAVELLTSSGKLDEATYIVLKTFELNNPPKKQVVKYLLKSLAEAKNVERLEAIGKLLNDKQKRDFAFDSKVTKAKINIGLVGELLNYLENVVSTGSDEEIAKAVKKFPVSEGLIAAIEHDLEKCTQIAEKFAEKNLLSPVNLLWMEMFINERHDKSNELWNKYLKDYPRIMFGRAIKLAMDSKKPQDIEKLINIVNSNSHITKSTVSYLYSKLIDCYCSLENDSKVKEVIKKTYALGFTSKNLTKNSIERAKKLIESKGGSFDLDLDA